MSNSSYAALVASFTRLYRYQHLAAMAGWDQAAMMPAKGNEARGAAMAELQVLMHRTLTDPTLKTLLKEAETEAADNATRASLREMKRVWQQANLLPERLVEASSLAGSRCEHGWRTQRAANDWTGFLQNFRPVVECAREKAQRLAEASGLAPYDALLEQFEPGMHSTQLTRIFGEVKSWLPGLIREVMDKQAGEVTLSPDGPFPVAAQRALGLEIMGLLGFDFDAGRLDISLHPFCGGVAEDVRITTRYREDDFMQSMMGIVHETGHACYEQHLPRDLVHLPVGQARSMGIHESQSLAFEMQLGRSPAFLERITPLVKKHLGDQVALDSANLARLYSRVKPGLIRVDADELTYPAHIILRFEIEAALIAGEIEAEDIPALWDEKMQVALGLDTRGNYRDGCLQDIHWTDGSFGYFPSYTLGAMYAAQYFATLRRDTPELETHIRTGNLAPVTDWLDRHIWQQGSLLETPALILQASGEALNPAYLRAHLEQRYLADSQ
ncbi:carboxypeptidase M32 [Rhodobacteraceae bacterium CH30]|nr:carboxypeptidase M32 [Rhodobacteraceae bacterium CH30]